MDNVVDHIVESCCFQNPHEKPSIVVIISRACSQLRLLLDLGVICWISGSTVRQTAVTCPNSFSPTGPLFIPRRKKSDFCEDASDGRQCVRCRAYWVAKNVHNGSEWFIDQRPRLSINCDRLKRIPHQRLVDRAFSGVRHLRAAKHRRSCGESSGWSSQDGTLLMTPRKISGLFAVANLL